MLNKSGNAAGLIPRNFLITILKRKAFYADPEDEGMLDSADRQHEGSAGIAARLSAVEEAEERNEESFRDPVTGSRD